MTVSVCVRSVSGSQLKSWLSTDDFRVLLLDCRSLVSYNKRHITQAFNVHCPLLLKRRMKSTGKSSSGEAKDKASAKGLLSLDHLVPCAAAKARLLGGFYRAVLVYDEESTVVYVGRGESEVHQDSITWVLESLLQETSLQHPVEKCFLVGGFNQFSMDFPSMCVTSPKHMSPTSTGMPVSLTVPLPAAYHTAEARACKTPTPSTAPRSPRLPLLRRGRSALSLPNLKCATSPPLSSDDHGQTAPAMGTATSSHATATPAKSKGRPQAQPAPVGSGGLAQDYSGPVRLLPHLYLGSNYHASRRGLLDEHGITAVLNVSRLPNYFPTAFRYMQIPVDDNTDADLLPWFEEATSFIESVKRNQGRVLVHCHAGISRSATICLAYLMKVRHIRLEEAFEFVCSMRTIISPNLAFMIQLQRFQDELANDRKENVDTNSPSCCLRSPGFFGNTNTTSTSSSTKYHPSSFLEPKVTMSSPPLSGPAVLDNGSTTTTARPFCLGNSALLMKRMSRSVSLPLSQTRSSSSPGRKSGLVFDFNLAALPMSGTRGCAMECPDLSPTPSPIFPSM